MWFGRPTGGRWVKADEFVRRSQMPVPEMPTALE